MRTEREAELERLLKEQLLFNWKLVALNRLLQLPAFASNQRLKERSCDRLYADGKLYERDIGVGDLVQIGQADPSILGVVTGDVEPASDAPGARMLYEVTWWNPVTGDQEVNRAFMKRALTVLIKRFDLLVSELQDTGGS